MKIIIVDDHILFREGVAAIIGAEKDIEISGLAGSVREAIELASRVGPDVILMDYDLPDGTGVDATRQILARQPGCKVIFLTVVEEDEVLIAAVRSGAKGYLLKTIHPKKLLAAMRSVVQGESAISRSMTLRLMEELARTKAPESQNERASDILTRREQDVLRVLATGLTNQEISEKLYLSTNTVKHHIHTIFDKLKITNRREAAHFARQYGLVNEKLMIMENI